MTLGPATPGPATSRSSTSRIRAIAGVGISPPLRLRHAARMMGTGGHDRQPGWLEAVLSWPQRFIRPGPADPDLPGTATG